MINNNMNNEWCTWNGYGWSCLHERGSCGDIASSLDVLYPSSSSSYRDYLSREDEEEEVVEEGCCTPQFVAELRCHLHISFSVNLINRSLFTFITPYKHTHNTAWPEHMSLEGRDIIVGGKYKIGRKIGAGSFGEIYLGKWRSFHVWVCQHPFPVPDEATRPIRPIQPVAIVVIVVVSRQTHTHTHLVVWLSPYLPIHLFYLPSLTHSHSLPPHFPHFPLPTCLLCARVYSNHDE